MADVIICGLGAMGSAAAYYLARRGRRVVGLEQFHPVHDRGSSHGETRMIRQSYAEHPSYVPLVTRAYELWDALEKETGKTGLLTRTGGLYVGPLESDGVAGALRSAKEHNLPHEMLDANEIRRRFPPMNPDPEFVGFYEVNTGFVRCEDAIRTFLDGAARSGADLHFHEKLTGWEARDGVVRVTTERGAYEAEHLILAPGAWAPEIAHFPRSGALRAERRVMYWMRPQQGIDPFRIGSFPCYTWELGGPDFLYGFPSSDNVSVKVALMNAGAPCNPDQPERNVTPDEVKKIQSFLGSRIAGLDGECLRAVTCMYTVTPDKHFVLGPHPHHPNVSVAMGFSGHGFKFACVVGEILTDLAVNGETAHTIDLFDPRRLSA